MPLPEQVQWKLYRAKQHYDELKRELTQYFQNEIGHLVEAPESTSDKRVYVYDTKEQVPARFGLIAGDFLQNIRSSLDYLVWQLVLANNKKPGRQNAFPICETPQGWEKSINENHRLKGVHPDAIAIIKSLQTCFFNMGHPAPYPLAVLEKLTNENKHQQVLFTGIVSGFKPDKPVPFHHIELQISRMRDGQTVPGERLLVYVAFKSGIVEKFEVLSCLDIISNFVGFKVLPQFERFFN